MTPEQLAAEARDEAHFVDIEYRWITPISCVYREARIERP